MQLAEEIFSWFVELEITESPSQLDETSFQSLLKDGKVLCNLALKLQPGSIAKINASPRAFEQMENIGEFLKWANRYGVEERVLFNRGVIHCIPCIPCIPFRDENVGKIVEILRVFSNFGFFAYHSTDIWGLHTIEFSRNYAPAIQNHRFSR